MFGRYLLSWIMLSATLIVFGAALFNFPASKPAQPSNQIYTPSRLNLQQAQPVTATATATPVPTATPRPAPTPTPEPFTSTNPAAPAKSGGLPIFPIFLALIFLGLILAVVVPFVRSKRR